jgi:hypothetical protein
MHDSLKQSLVSTGLASRSFLNSDVFLGHRFVTGVLKVPGQSEGDLVTAAANLC